MKKFLLISLQIIIFFLLLNYLSDRHFTIVFKDVRPFDSSTPVYYKGIKIGKVTGIKHSKDLQRTNVKITLYNSKLKFPLNTKAVLKKRTKGNREFDYIDLIYPNIPSENYIKEFSHIHGISSIDVKEYLKNQNIEDLERIKSNLLSASENLNSSLDAIGGMFILIQDILQENRMNFLGSTQNIKKTTANLENLTKKIDNIIVEEQWNNTFNDIEKSSSDIHKFTRTINNTATDFENTIPETLQNTNKITKNLSSITCGIRQTLSKKFGGLRLFFGKVID